VNETLAHLQEVIAQGNWGYHPTGPQATEPAALACLALVANNMQQEALPLANWLAELQSSHGAVGVTEEQETPSWPTSLAMLAWQACDQAADSSPFEAHRQKALDWTLKSKGKPIPRNAILTTLIGWSWAYNTHSWLEPTCLFTLALKATGQSEHQRTREAVLLLIDRLLENGGCNYGNTMVLGQSTRPHVQPTGLAMLALAGESTNDPRVDRSLDYLEQQLTEETTTASLCFGLLGLTAHQRRPKNAEALLQHALRQDLNHHSSNCYKLALLTLAGSNDLSWLPKSASTEKLSPTP